MKILEKYTEEEHALIVNVAGELYQHLHHALANESTSLQRADIRLAIIEAFAMLIIVESNVNNLKTAVNTFKANLDEMIENLEQTFFKEIH